MTNQPIPRVGTKSKCRHCGEEIIYEPWFRDGRGPNPPIWAHTKGPRTCGTRPKGWRRDSWPFAEPEPEEADLHVCGNCDGVDPDTCLANPSRSAQCWRNEPHAPHTWTLSPEEGGADCPGIDQPAPAPSPLRDLYAAAIASYDHAVGQATDPAPRGHHYGQADAVLAVRDRELEQLRAQVDELEAKADGWRHQAFLNSQAITRIQDAATLHRQGLIGSLELYAVIGAACNPQEQP